MILEINSIEQAVNALDTIKKYLESNIKSIVSPRIGEPFYVDLGLPSGKKWSIVNQIGYYNHEEALRIFGQMLPTHKDWRELCEHCKATYDEKSNSMVFTGPNKAQLTFPLDGYVNSFSNEITNKSEEGVYWSRDTYKNVKEDAVCIEMNPVNDNGFYIDAYSKTMKFCVRLIQKND